MEELNDAYYNAIVNTPRRRDGTLIAGTGSSGQQPYPRSQETWEEDPGSPYTQDTKNDNNICGAAC